MNWSRASNIGRDLMSAAQEALSQHGFDAQIVSGQGKSHDGRIRIKHRGRAHSFRVEAKKTVTHATVGTFLLKHSDVPSDLIVVTEYVTPPIADELRRYGIQFVDAAGNAFLNRDGLYVFVTGRKSRQPIVAARPSRAFQDSGLRLTFALLTSPDLSNQTFRKIAAETRVAIGTVHWVMKDLRDHGFLADIAGGRRLLDRSRLVIEWAEAYNRVLRPKLLLAQFASDTPDWWRSTKIEKYGAVWGGEIAAARLTKSLKPGTATIYADKIPHKLIIDRRLKPDPEGQVEMRRRFWHIDDEWRRRGVTPPLLVYADLVAIGDARSGDAARLVYERYLSGPLRER